MQTMPKRWCKGAAVLAVCGLMASPSHAQTTPESEYRKLINVNEDIQSLGAQPFGERVDLYSGGLSFEVTDISEPGNGPLLTLGRSLRTAEDKSNSDGIQRSFGEWRLEIPRIETMAAHQKNVLGWEVFNNDDTRARTRCTNFQAPPPVQAQIRGFAWNPREWWYGYHLIVPGQGDQLLLPRSSNPHTPTISGQTFPIVTKQDWMVGCGVTASDGGEGFLAIAPDGTRYTFAHLVYRSATYLQKPVQAGPNVAGELQPMEDSGNILTRNEAMMYVTQIQDRFGNTLTFDWNGDDLTAIRGSDGRALNLTYVAGTAQIHTATLQSTSASPRTWTYSYDANASFPSLTGVQLPDGSAWSYQLGLLESGTLRSEGNCQSDTAPNSPSQPVSATMTHPSGLTATFTVAPVLRGRSYVPKGCWSPYDGSNDSYADIPNAFIQYAITKEVLSGPGVPTGSTWTWSYSSANQSWLSDACAANSSCLTSIYTDVTYKDDTIPGGQATRYTFSNLFGATEGQLQKTEYYSGAVGSPIVRSVVNTYADPGGGPWPSEYGNDLQVRDNSGQVLKLAPLMKRVITQDGDTYTWLAEAFNNYAQVTKVKRSNSTTTTALEEQTAYLNDTSHWVLGLPTTVTNVTNPSATEVESQNDYDPTKLTLSKRYRFGQVLMSYVFDAQGQLQSFTDGNNNTTTLGNYKRGIPQTITYPDTKHQSLVVDDLGQISSITDRAGNTTSYQYDGIGRLKRITYPASDEQAWADKTFDYVRVASAERGIAANHWRRTVTVGSYKQDTFYDAFLRPVLVDTTGGTQHTSARTDYDWRGLKTFESYATADSPNLSAITAGTHNTYDALGRLTKIQQNAEPAFDPLTTTISYLAGASRKVTDPKSHVTTTSYQVFDEPSYDAPIQVVAPAGINQTITRDAYGNPKVIRQYGTFNGFTEDVTKKLFYDGYHRLCRRVEPESYSEVMGYDGANNLVWSVSGVGETFPSTDEGCHAELETSSLTIHRTYDALNRLWKIAPLGDTQGTTYHYDDAGDMDSAISGITTWSAQHNKRGMLTSETLQLSGQSAWTIGYAHDANGSLRQLTYPDGEAVAYAPDGLGRATRAGNYVTGVTYAPNGTVAAYTYGNGATSYFDQNDRQLLSNFTIGRNGVPDLSEDFAYDADGNITGITDQAGGPRTKSFGYDELNRLTSATAPGLGINESYKYDPLNNIRSRVSGGATYTYNYDALKRLSSITSGSSSAPFTYDYRGNVTGKNGVTLDFDQKNQLLDLSGHVTYAYDAAGRRVEKAPISGNPTYYFYTQGGQLLYQVDANTTATNFIYLGTHLVARNVTNLQAPPAAPTLTVPTTSTNGSYTVSWTTAAGATYNLQEQVNGGAWTAAYSGNAASKAFSGKANGTYGYRVQACNGAGCGAYSTVKSVTVLYVPAAPATITVPATSTGSIAVSWAASSTATSYTLQQRLGTGGWTTAYSGGATSTTRTVTASGSYTFQVQACNASGCSAWKASSAVSVTVKPASAPTLTVPASSSTGSYTVSWTTVTGATSYTLQEQTNGGGWTSIYTGSAASKAISSKANGTYGYHVEACNASGCGPWSAIKSISVTHVPAMPTGLSGTVWVFSDPALSSAHTSRDRVVGASVMSPNRPPGRYELDATWSSSSGATSYNLQYCQGGICQTKTMASPGIHSIPVNGTNYIIKVQACNAGGCSAYSAGVTPNVQQG